MKKIPRNWPRCYPSGKFVYSRKEARREVRWHESQACSKCMNGRFVWQEYSCDVGSDGLHWHIGHEYLAVRQMA